jgi:hypothetical protein
MNIEVELSNQGGKQAHERTTLEIQELFLKSTHDKAQQKQPGRREGK